MRRAPVFAGSTIVILALGVGANTGAFSALNTLLLKPLPYPEPERLVTLYETTVDRKPRGVSEMNLLDWRARTHLFESMGAYQPRTFGLTVGASDPVTVIQTGMVMADFFRVIGVPPALGRAFSETEEVAESKLIVLTDTLWRRQFGANPGILRRKIFLNEEPYSVIGVMPSGFEYPMGRGLADAFIPLSRRDYCCSRLGQQQAVARLRLGAGVPAARAELEAVAAAMAREYAATNAGRSAGLEPLQQTLTGSRREPLWLLTAAAALLFAIAVANVSGLILARCLGRAHETAVRIAVGAGGGRLARQFFTEAAVWSAAGAAGGWAAAGLVLRLVPKFVPGAGLAPPLHLDGAAFAFAASSATSATLLLGLAPALFAWRTDLNLLMKTGGSQTTRVAHRRWGTALAIAQVSLSVVLLLGTALLLRSFLHLVTVNPGFETAHVLRFGIGLPEKRYDTDQKLIDFHHQVLQRLGGIPSVLGAGAAGRFPLTGATGEAPFQIAGAGIPAAQRPQARISAVTPGYFEAMSIPLLEGRDFSWRDDRSNYQFVAIVNQTFARMYLRGRPRLGTRIDAQRTDWTIVGVVSDSRQASMDREPLPEIFLSISQTGADGAVYAVRTREGGNGLAQVIASKVAEQDPRLERVSPEPLRLVVERSLSGRKTAVVLIGSFAGLALLLTAIGIYGTVAVRAAERSREMAIRAALGADGSQIRALVLSQGAWIAGAGIAGGLLAFLAAAPLLKSQLFGVSMGDPLSLILVTLSVLATALLASFAPSRRAAQAAPADLLRND